MDPKGALGAASIDRVYKPLSGLSLRMSGHWRAGYADLVLAQVKGGDCCFIDVMCLHEVAMLRYVCCALTYPFSPADF